MTMSRLQEVIARVEAASAGAEPSADVAGEASQTDGATSAEGSASADASTTNAASDVAPPGDTDASSAPQEATNAPDEALLREKLERDRERRELKAMRRRAKEESDAAERARKEAEAAREKWSKLGTSGTILETIREAGLDPKAVFEAMRDEALKAGTPDEKIAGIERAYNARLDAMEKALKEEREARENERKQARAASIERAFERDFDHAIRLPMAAPLLEEYDAEELLPLVKHFRDDPETLFGHAERLGVDLGFDLTDPDAQYNILHIFQVLRAQHDAHHAKRQRRTQKAEPQTSQPEQQPAEAKRPTVNGTEARNAGSTITNDLAASSAGAAPDPSGESHKERVKRLIAQFG